MKSIELVIYRCKKNFVNCKHKYFINSLILLIFMDYKELTLLY